MPFGVVAGRADGGEGVLRLARHHRVDAAHGGADGVHLRLPRPRRGDGVGIDAGQPLLGDRGADVLDEALRMRERDHLRVGRGRLLPHERVEGLVLERRGDRAQPVRAFGMADRREVLQEDRMVQEKGRHVLVCSGW